MNDSAGSDHRQIGVSIIGSTGSIGTQTLEVIENLPDRFRIVALAAGSKLNLLFEQAKRHSVDLIASAAEPSHSIGLTPTERMVCGEAGLLAVATHPEADIVVVATSGHTAIRPTMAAIAENKIIALANKESIVCAGELIMPLAKSHGVEIRPIDSEHSAIWQCLTGNAPESVSRLILTASGGPFRQIPLDALDSVTLDNALKHPTWKMGKKVTIDSATMVNKGLELIEARWLFDVSPDQIDVVVHPQSIVHSIVEFVDGSQLAQMSWPDMRLPIQYALTFPDRIAGTCRQLDLTQAGPLEFLSLDQNRYPTVELAREAVRSGDSYPAALSAADEIAVDAFVQGTIRFTDITRVIERTLDRHKPRTIDSVDTVLEVDEDSRKVAREIVSSVA